MAVALGSPLDLRVYIETEDGTVKCWHQPVQFEKQSSGLYRSPRAGGEVPFSGSLLRCAVSIYEMDEEHEIEIGPERGDRYFVSSDHLYLDEILLDFGGQ